MKKVLLTLTAILTLASCQDKFEQIDANFLYQQEQIEALKIDLDVAVTDLQSQIDATNNQLVSDVESLTGLINDNAIAQAEVNELIFSTLTALENADAELRTYTDELDAIQAELLNATVDQISKLEDSQESIKNDITAMFLQLETDFESKFRVLAESDQELISSLFNHLQLETILAWEIIVDNSVTNVTENAVHADAGTSSSTTVTDTTTVDPVTPEPVVLTPEEILYNDILAWIQSGPAPGSSTNGNFGDTPYTVTLTASGFYSLDANSNFDFGSVLNDGGETGVARKFTDYITNL